MTSKNHGFISHLCTLITTCLRFFSSFSLSPPLLLFVPRQMCKHKSSSAAIPLLEGNRFLFPAVELSIRHHFFAGCGPSQSWSRDMADFFTGMCFFSRRGRVPKLSNFLIWLFFLCHLSCFLFHHKFKLSNSDSSALAVRPPAGRASK